MIALLLAAALAGSPRTLSVEPRLPLLLTIALQSAALELGADVRVIMPGAEAELRVDSAFALRDTRSGTVLATIPPPRDDAAIIAGAGALLTPLRGVGEPPPLLDPDAFARGYSKWMRWMHGIWIEDSIEGHDEKRSAAEARQNRKSCRAGDAIACAGVCWLESKHCRGLQQRLLEQCAAGDARACSAAERWAGSDDARRALAQRACELGEATACNDETSIGFPDNARARQVAERACASGAPNACARRAYEIADAPIWEAKKRAVHERLCAADAFLCDEACHPQSDPDCLIGRARACEADNVHACARLGERLLHGEPERADQATASRAASLFKRACEAHVGHGCAGLGHLALAAGDLPRARAHYESGCRWGDNRACNAMGDFYRDGRGVQRNPRRAHRYYMRACSVGPMAECHSEHYR
jgi:TPR repeat protein